MHFGTDFQSVFESRAQVRVCQNRMNYIGFRRFFASRLFFERVGSPEQRSVKMSSAKCGERDINIQNVAENES